MATATNNDSRKSVDHASVFADPAALHEVLDEVFAAMPLRQAAQREEPVAPLPTPPTAVRRKPAARPVQVAHQPRPRTRLPADDNDSDWFYYAKQTICVGLMLLGAVLFYRGMPSSWRAAVNPFADSPAATANSTPATYTSGEKGLRTKRIEDARVGDRFVGRNPIREQADLVEPDPATWRKISLYMTKESGLGLWIDLLRPVTWIEEYNAQVGSTIYIDLYEMGAVGDAEVTYLGPCPKIQPGTGTVVTGTFKHQADENSNVVNLKLEDQIELTGVTANHPYWSEDRQDFVEVGNLRVGELVDTDYGLKHVVSVTPIAYSEFLYNLETTEHVYRVGSLGTLVHNSCILLSKMHTLDLGNSDWRRAAFSNDGLVYILRDAKTGELLKVGQSTSGTFIGRFEKYAAAARRNGRELSLDVFEVPLAQRGAVEGEIRRTLGNLFSLPWDNTQRRLGFSGPGVP